MSPERPAMPDALGARLASDFGSADAFKAQFAAAAKAVEGSGWAALVWEPLLGRLLVLQVEKHQNLTVWGCVPLLVCDVWEHAYYVTYQNRRADYVDGWMRLVNWPFAADRLRAATAPAG
jgi:Fe-Mn family superoxide dismutase